MAAAEPADLERELRAVVRGPVRFDRLARALYATDASIYEIVPTGVVLPRDIEDVRAVLAVCRRHGVPIVPRGAGTGIAGGAVGSGVALDLARFLTRIGPIDPDRRTVHVEPGVVLDDLNASVARWGLHFAPDVATSSRATIGGMIANNSCGAHSILYGRTVDHLVDLTVVLADGSVVTWEHDPAPDLPPASTAGSGTAPGVGETDPRTARQRPDASRLGAEPPAAGPAGVPADLPGPAALLRELECVRREYRDEVLARYPRVMRRNGGYALDRLCMSVRLNPATLLAGSEGTLGLIVGATLRLTPLPRHRALLVLHFGSVLEALAATPRLLSHRPAAVELVDERILEAGAAHVPAAVRGRFLSGSPRAILVCELFDDDPQSLRERMQTLERATADTAAHAARAVWDPDVQQAVWRLRNKGFGLLTSRPGDSQPIEFIEDAAVDPLRLRDYIADLDAVLASEGVGSAAYYAHASVGVIHVRPVLNLKSATDVGRMRRIAERTCALVQRYGGAMTGEHGDGLLRSEWLERMYGQRIVEAFGRVKRAFDPDNLFNPGKIVDPLPMDRHLRYGPAWRARHVPTHFDYGPYGGPAGLAGMCTGVGLCRQKLTGVMCPSYMATLEETHTTRARANALRLALSNRGLLEGLDDPALDEVMDLCLMCKACKSECPTGVDMARLKSEWLAHRHERRGPSRGDRLLAHVATVARLGSRMPRLVNWIARSAPLRWLLERWFDLDRRIAPPALARATLRHWLASRATGRAAGRGTAPARAVDVPPGGVRPARVIYFADTFTRYYWPQPGMAAVLLLEAAGLEVIVPELECCGRPLISKGFLHEARELARRNVERLLPYVRAGTPIVGSEPSCILTLRDEYPALLPTASARAVAEATQLVDSLLAGRLRRQPDLLRFRPAGPSPPLLHAHCHHKALVGTDDTMFLLRLAGGEQTREIDGGCCGMAGSFGHERRHYEVARAIGQQRLFPAVQARGQSEVLVTGFSCREQIAHHTDLSPRHVLEFLAEAAGCRAAFAD